MSLINPNTPQYDPDIMSEAAKMDFSLAGLASDKWQVNKQTGFWMHYAFGIVGMYRDDYLKIGGFKLVEIALC